MPQFNDPTTELSYLEKDDVLMAGSPSDFSNIKAQNLFNRSLTRVQLQALITASALVIGQEYTITDAVGSTLVLVVKACAVNKINEVALNITDDNNVTYDITADTISEIVYTNTASTPTYAAQRLGTNTNGINTPSNLGGSIEYATSNQLYVAKTSTNGGIMLDKIVNSTTDGAGFIGRKARGNPNALADVQTGDQIGYVDFRSFSGNIFWQQVSIYSTVKGSFTPGQAPPADLRFATCVAGGVSTYRGSISPEGYWYLNTESQDATSAGSILTVKSITNEWTSVIVNRATTGATYGLRVHTGGATANDIPFGVSSGSGTGSFVMAVYGNGKIGINKLSPTEALDVLGNGVFSGSIKIGNTVAASVATPSTHKVTMVIGGVTYYLLATNA